MYEFLKYTKILILCYKSNTKNADKNIVCELAKYAQKSLQSVNIILHKYGSYY